MSRSDSAWSQCCRRPGAARIIVAVLASMLAGIFFATAAAEHGRRINTSKARGDQSGYLFDAKNMYANFHGQRPRVLIGERNRMPMYAGYLALFYDPTISDWAFFDIGKRANVGLALAALALLGLIFWRLLPPLPAINLLGITAFGWFIYKASYTQSELLFYTLFFLAFLVSWGLLRAPVSPRIVVLGATAGFLCALAHLTKASMPPFIGVFTACVGAKAVFERIRPGTPARAARLRWSVAALLTFGLVFVGVLLPYLATNKQVFGRYFYNVNSTFYAWYDNWAAAATGTLLHGDGVGWPAMPETDIPSASRYFREHTVVQIAERIWSGVKDMAVVSYRTYDYLGWLVLYTALLVLVAWTRWSLFAGMIRERAWLVAFLLAYGIVYFFATAFYFPISGTGTARFLLAHLLPYFFVLTHAFSRSRLADVQWSIVGRPVRLTDFHWCVVVLLVFDVSLRTWPRLMTTYGGF